jgi:hypothetical protein
MSPLTREVIFSSPAARAQCRALMSCRATLVIDRFMDHYPNGSLAVRQKIFFQRKLFLYTICFFSPRKRRLLLPDIA